MLDMFKGGLIWGLVKFVFIISLSFTIFVFGVSLSLFFTYGVLENITSGADILGSMNYLLEQTPGVILQEFGRQIFTNIPFADFANAVFITHVQPDVSGLFPDVVTAALAGLIFYIIARLNRLFSMFVKNRMLFGSIVSVMTVLSICLAMIGTAWMNNHLEGNMLFIAQWCVFGLSLLIHTLFLFIGLKGIRFMRILLHTLLDLVEGICNNVFLWFCSYLFMYWVPALGFAPESSFAVAAMGGFVLFGIYSLVMDAVTSFLWNVSA